MTGDGSLVSLVSVLHLRMIEIIAIFKLVTQMVVQCPYEPVLFQTIRCACLWLFFSICDAASKEKLIFIIIYIKVRIIFKQLSTLQRFLHISVTSSFNAICHAFLLFIDSWMCYFKADFVKIFNKLLIKNYLFKDF